MRKLSYSAVIILLSFIMAGCSYIRGERTFLKERNFDYQNSQSAVVLKVPPALHDNEIDDSYYIPALNSNAPLEEATLLPPGSLAAQMEELEYLKELQAEQEENE